MDSGKAVASGVTTPAPGAPSINNVASKNENIETTPPGMASTMLVSTAGSEKKRRGRPRKYKPDELSSSAFPLIPPSSSAPPSTGRTYAGEGKMNVVRSANPERKLKNKVGAEKLDEFVDCSTGSSFAPHVLTINAGEDISMKIMEFSLQGPRSVCVISGSGSVSNVTIQHPDSSGSTLRYEGLFEIISFNGSFTPVEMADSRFGRSGMMSMTLSGTDGRVIGGVISGVTIAASPVKVTVVSFLEGNPLEHKSKKQKIEIPFVTKLASAPSGPSQPAMMSNINMQRAPSCSTSQNPNKWSPMQSDERSRNSTADINISLHG